MNHDAGPDPAAVHLHLHRGIGWGLYGTATVFVSVIVLLGTVSNLQSGRFVTAAALAVVGSAVAAFLALMTHSMVTPALTVSAAGVDGRIPWGGRVDATWNEVVLDVDEKVGPGAIRLGVGTESVSVNARSWVGFPDFVLLVASTPDAVDRMTPAAVQEVIRLLQGGPSEDRSERQ